MLKWVAIAVLFVSMASSLVRAQATQPVTKPDINYAAFEKLGWKLSCQAYTFRALTLFETLDVLHSLDIHYIEMYPGQRLSKDHPLVFTKPDMPANFIKELKDKLAATNVTVLNYGVVELPNDETKARKVFDFAKELGLITIVSEPPAEAFELIDRLANEYQMNVAIHDHPKPSKYWNPEAVLKVCEGRSKRIGSCADVGHWYTSDLVPVECLKKLEGRIISMHLKERNKEKKDVIFGQGQCDFPAMLREIKRQGVRPVMSIEYESSTDQTLINNVAKSIEFLNAQATMLASEK